MRRLLKRLLFAFVALMAFSAVAAAQGKDSTAAVADSTAAANVAAADTADITADLANLDEEEPQSFHQVIKTKFIEGSAGFMSLVALALVLGLAFCIERIIYLIDGAKAVCHGVRGPVAAICRQGLSRIDDSIDNIERGISSYGSVQAANLEKGCSWITLFIAIAPSLGFLGTVIGMVMAFEQIQMAGDISPTIVASGMKVALITTIFGIIAALILQVFYNYIISKIENITGQMEESAITLLDSILKYKIRVNGK